MKDLNVICTSIEEVDVLINIRKKIYGGIFGFKNNLYNNFHEYVNQWVGSLDEWDDAYERYCEGYRNNYCNGNVELAINDCFSNGNAVYITFYWNDEKCYYDSWCWNTTKNEDIDVEKELWFSFDKFTKMMDKSFGIASKLWELVDSYKMLKDDLVVDNKTDNVDEEGLVGEVYRWKVENLGSFIKIENHIIAKDKIVDIWMDVEGEKVVIELDNKEIDIYLYDYLSADNNYDYEKAGENLFCLICANLK